MPLPQYTPIERLKELHAKILFSKTDAISKITDGSVVNAMIYANSKLAQKGLKDISLSASHLFPDTAHGEYLDEIASNYGIPSRYGPSISSMYVRFFGDVGTTYTAFNHNIQTDEGIEFELTEDVVIGSFGFAYGLCRSLSASSTANVSAYSVNSMTNEPPTHSNVVNEYAAWGGRDVESDDDFRNRIKDSFNIVSTGTYNKLTIALQQFQPTILRIMSHGLNANGKLILAVVTRSGTPLSQFELDELRDNAFEYMSISESNVYYLSNKGVEFVNVEWFPVDISMRVRTNPNFDLDVTRKRMHASISKLFDPRSWNQSKKVEWDDILQVAKRTLGIDYVSDASFLPRVDLPVTAGSLPRVRMFEMRNLDGDLLFSNSDQLSPVDYEQYRDPNFLATVIQGL